MRIPALLCLGAAVLSPGASPLSAQVPNPPHVAVPVLPKAPSMARDADLSTWDGALRISGFGMEMPDDKGVNRWPTVAHLAFGPDALYVAFECEDPDPHAVRAARHRRDDFTADLDFVGIDLDASGKGQSTLRLLATPLGGQFDAIVTDAAGENYTYDCLWDSVGVLTPKGYVVKIRVPYSSLRRRPGDWGVRFLRIMPRERRYGIVWPPMSRDVQCDLCQMAQVSGAPVTESASPFMIIPSVTSTRTDDLGAPTDQRTRLGLDARYATSSMTFEGTYRPDFATADADVDPLQINSRFRVLYPEHRPFFLEGMELLGVSGAQQQFFSRAVAAPLYGLKASGQSAWASWSALTAKDEQGGAILDAANPGGVGGADGLPTRDFAAAARFRLDDRSSGISLVGTDKLLLGGPEGSGGKSGGVYYDQWLGPEFHFSGSAVEALARLPQADGSVEDKRGTATSLRLDWNTRNWFASASNQATSPDLVLASGFTDLQGYRIDQASFGWQDNWNAGPFARANAKLRARRLAWWGGDPFDRALGLDAYLETAGRWGFTVNWDIAGRTWAANRVDSVASRSVKLQLDWKRLSQAQLSVFASRARTLDLASGAPATLRTAGLSSHGGLGDVTYDATLQQAELDREADGLRLIRAREVSASGTWQLPAHFYLRTQGFVVRYDGAEADLTDKYLKVFAGWQPNAFTEAYLGWSGQRHRDPLGGLPQEAMVERGLFAKVAYAIQF